MAGLYPLSRMQQFDGNGRPLSGARLFLFDGGTSTPRIGYRNSSLTSPHPNPILADSAGRLPLVYLDDGFYRHRLTTRTGTLVFDDDGLPVLSTTTGGSGTSVDPDSIFKTRDIKIRFDDQPLAGYVRLNGRTIGSATSGATERANADTQSLYEELWPFANIGVTGGKGASAAADFAANKPLVLPNAAGRGLFGMDNMGAGAQGVLTDGSARLKPAAARSNRRRANGFDRSGEHTELQSDGWFRLGHRERDDGKRKASRTRIRSTRRPASKAAIRTTTPMRATRTPSPLFRRPAASCKAASGAAPRRTRRAAAPIIRTAFRTRPAPRAKLTTIR